MQPLPESIFGAAKSGDVAQIYQFLRAGADVNGEDADHNTPLMWAAWYGHYAAVDYLIINGAKVNKEYGGCTALYEPARTGRKDVCVRLLQAGADRTEYLRESYEKQAVDKRFPDMTALIASWVWYRSCCG